MQTQHEILGVDVSRAAERWARPAAIGALTGLRSSAGLRHAFGEEPWAKGWMNVLCWGEALADKLPIVPDRTQAASILGRGAIAGWAASQDVKKVAEDSEARGREIEFALVGAAAALATTYVACELRKRLARDSRLASIALGFVEDAAVAFARRGLEGRA